MRIIEWIEVLNNQLDEVNERHVECEAEDGEHAASYFTGICVGKRLVLEQMIEAFTHMPLMLDLPELPALRMDFAPAVAAR